MIPLDDRGFTLGDGLFDTALALGGRVAFDEVPDALTRLGSGESVGRLVLVL